MAKKSARQSLRKTVKRSLSKEHAKVEKTKREVLAKGAKHIKPITLARHRVVRLTLWVLFGTIVLFLAVVSSLIYFAKNDSALVFRVSQIVPFPAASVNGKLVSYADYLFEVRYHKNIYENPTGPASASQDPVDFEKAENQELLKDIQQSAFKRAKTKAVIRQLAKQNNISVSPEELELQINQLIERQGGEAKFGDAIAQYYGWNLEDFRKEFELQLVQQKLQLALLPEFNSSLMKRAQRLQERAAQGEDFAKLAAKFSNDPASKQDGGNLGYVGQETPYVAEFKEAALKLKTNKISEVVVTQFGFHIIKATAQKGDQVKVSHILVEFDKNLDTVLDEALAEAKTKDYIKLPEAKAVPKPT